MENTLLENRENACQNNEEKVSTFLKSSALKIFGYHFNK